MYLERIIMSTEPTEQAQEKPILNIVGTKVALGPVHRALQPLLLKWANDFAVSILSGDPLKPTTQERLEAQYEQWNKDEQHRWIIYEQSTLRPIGDVGLRQIDHRNGTAIFGILIGEKDCWNKGFGTEAAILILDYGFT